MTAALTTRTCSVFLERPKVTGGLQLLSQASALLRRGETRGDSPKPAPKPLCFSFSRPPAPHCYFCLKVLGWQWLKLETHSVWNQWVVLMCSQSFPCCDVKIQGQRSYPTINLSYSTLHHKLIEKCGGGEGGNELYKARGSYVRNPFNSYRFPKLNNSKNV